MSIGRRKLSVFSALGLISAMTLAGNPTEAATLNFTYFAGSLGGRFSYDTDTGVYSNVVLPYLGPFASNPNHGVTQPFTWYSLTGLDSTKASSGDFYGFVGGGLLIVWDQDISQLSGTGSLTGAVAYNYKNAGCNCGGYAGGGATFVYQDAAVPLPASLPLLAAALAGLGLRGRRKSWYKRVSS